MATNNLGWTLMLISPSEPIFQDYERDADGRQTTAGTFNPEKWNAYASGIREVIGEDAWNAAVQAGYITPEGFKQERSLPPLAPDYGNLPHGKMWYPTPQGATPDYVDPNYGPLTIGNSSRDWNPEGLIMFLAASVSMGAAAYFAPAIAAVAPSAAAEVTATAAAIEGGTAAATAGGMGGGTASLFGPSAGLAADLTAPALTPAFTSGAIASGMPAALPALAAPAATFGGAAIPGGTAGLFGPTPAGAGSLIPSAYTLGDLTRVPGDAYMPGELASDPSVNLQQVPGDAYLPGDLANDPSINLQQVPGDAYLPGDLAPTGPGAPVPGSSNGSWDVPPVPTGPGKTGNSFLDGIDLGDLLKVGGLIGSGLWGQYNINKGRDQLIEGIDNATADIGKVVIGAPGASNNAGGNNPTKPPGTPGGSGNPYGSAQIGANGLYEGGTLGMWNPFVQAGYDALNRTGSRPASSLYAKFGAPVAAPTGMTLGKLARPARR